MNARLSLMLLGGASALFVIIIGLELIPGNDMAPVGTAPTQASVRPGHVKPEANPDDTEAEVAGILARPLFDPARKPQRIEGPLQTSSGEAPSSLPRLSGILVSGDQKRAIFQGDGDDAVVTVVGEGEEIAGWMIQEIAAGGVTIAGPDGTQTLQPKLDPNAKPGEPALPAQPPQPHPPIGMMPPQAVQAGPQIPGRFQMPPGIHGPVPHGRPGIVPQMMQHPPSPTGGNR